MKPITDSGVKPITQSGQAEHLSERSDAKPAGLATRLDAYANTSVKRGVYSKQIEPGDPAPDGLACFNGVTAADCVHEPMVTGGGKAAVERPEFRWVNTILGNIKNALRGTYHAIRPKYAQRYLAEFEYRFNRRFDLPDIIPRLVYVALRTPPMPERLLKLRLA